MVRRVVALVVLASLAGCVTREIRATPGELEAARHLFRQNMPAPIKTAEHGTVSVAPAQRIAIVDTANKRFDIRLDEVMRDCADHPPQDNRLCELHNVQHVVLGKDRKMHEAVVLAPLGTIIIGGAFATVIGVTYCAWECEGLDQRASQIGFGAMAIGLAYLLLTRGFAR